MRVWRRLAGHLAGVVALAATGLAATAASAEAPTQVPGDGVAAGVAEYVALGDSFTSGPFIPRTLAAFGCFRSTRNYPSLVGKALDVAPVIDVSCAGADTRDLLRPQAGGFMAMPAQLSALSSDTDLVTVGIGGNDFGLFARLVGVCGSLRSVDPDGSPCRDRLADDGEDVLRQASRVGPRVADVLAEISRRSPQAQVLVVGYPRIVPRTGTCPAVLPFADGDYRFADTVTRRLNSGLRAAARSADAGFVDMYAASAGHDACAGRRAWVNGQVTDPERAQRYHPFRRYMVEVATRVVERVRS